MPLKEYVKKRNLKKTPEPRPKKTSSTYLNFCVQKHAARRLHYDFRLEYRGILLSWAIPKGPSLDPKDKRLAIKVEDHPLEYQYFEGTIPKGNYGAGTVEIWDHGSYQISGAHSKQEAEKIISNGLKEGHLSIILNGDKLQGEFIFQKLKQDPKDHSWLLFKKKDTFAVESDEITPSREKKSKPDKMPSFVMPMLPTLVEQPFDDEDWLFEIKWDGYRALAFIQNGNVELKSRTKKSWNTQFPDIIENLKKISGQAVLDGELVVLDKMGKSHFQLMQQYQKEKEGALCYYAFDILYHNGKDLRGMPLIQRKEILKKLLSDHSLPQVRFSDHIVKNGIRFFKEASKQHLEGIVAKQLISTYQSKRSREWLKIKTTKRQEVVIGGFTAPKGSREKFGALLIGTYKNKELQYIGHVGGGFDKKLLTEVYDHLKPLIQKQCPFKQIPKTNTSATWIKPTLVCEVSFSEWTQDRSLRHPIFEGLRLDKRSQDVTKEVPQKIQHSAKVAITKSNTSDPLALTHLEKMYWPTEKYTKGDLIHYYKAIADYIIPHLKGRPIMLHRYPNGITGNDFYQKNLETHPDWIVTKPVQHEGKEDHYLFIEDLPSLLYAINLGSIDLHPFLARYKNLENPDFCVIDLDPHDIPFKEAVAAALIIHNLLEKLKVPHYCKTSGGKGLHILIPFKGKYNFTQARQFAELIGHYVHRQLPQTTSLERNPKKRLNKVYIDCLQNRSGQTIVAPYCVRPRPHALVSTPLFWEEVNEKLDPHSFDLNTVPKRLKKIGDIWKDIRKKGISLQKLLKHFEKFISD